jgi:hypothetical protein
MREIKGLTHLSVSHHTGLISRCRVNCTSVNAWQQNNPRLPKRGAQIRRENSAQEKEVMSDLTCSVSTPCNRRTKPSRLLKKPFFDKERRRKRLLHN